MALEVENCGEHVACMHKGECVQGVTCGLHMQYTVACTALLHMFWAGAGPEKLLLPKLFAKNCIRDLRVMLPLVSIGSCYSLTQLTTFSLFFLMHHIAETSSHAFLDLTGYPVVRVHKSTASLVS